MRGNVTIDPLACATAVLSPEIREIRSLKSGQVLDAARFIQSIRYDRLVRVRTGIKEAISAGYPRVVCAICGTSVYLVSTQEKRFFFRHTIEDNSCPARTRTGLSEDDIRAMKYKGAQESEAHKRLKRLIERSLRADSRFEDVCVEATWRSQRNPATLRRPDIRAKCGDSRFAFEAQLSTTFLDVVIGRKTFYRSEGALLVWVLPFFDPAYRQLTVDDLLFNNNSNVLVVDRLTAEASETAGRLTVRCAFRRPIMFEGALSSRWESRLVTWDELIIDLEGQRIFAFDTSGEERRLEDERGAQKQWLRELLITFAVTRGTQTDWRVREAQWKEIQDKYLAYGLSLPGELDIDHRFLTLVRAVQSALSGKPEGYGFDKLIQVAHNLADHYPEVLIPFSLALRLGRNQEILSGQDKEARWSRKLDAHREAFRKDNTIYRLPDDLQSLLRFIFPDLAPLLKPPASL